MVGNLKVLEDSSEIHSWDIEQAAWGVEGEDTLDTGKALTGPQRLHDKRAKIHMLKASFFLASTEASAWQ